MANLRLQAAVCEGFPFPLARKESGSMSEWLGRQSSQSDHWTNRRRGVTKKEHLKYRDNKLSLVVTPEAFVSVLNFCTF